MATNQLKVFLMLFWDHFWKKWRMQDLKVVNYLGTALFCGKFNLVDTDQFSCEYLVWVLCYCSQTDVLFFPLGSRTCPYPRRWECPTHCGSETRKVVQPWYFFCWILMLWAGWLLSSSHKMSKIFQQPFCFYQTWRKYNLKPQKCQVVCLATGRSKNSLVF